MTAAASEPAGVAPWRRSVSAGLRRIAALGRAEGLLLRRNGLAVVIALALPLGTVLAVPTSPELAGAIGSSTGAAVITAVTAVSLNLFVYYHLVTTLVARREELVLKRLRTGEPTDFELLAGTATPAVAVAWAQIVLTTVIAAALFDVTAPVNFLLVITAIFLGTAVFVLLAAASTALTPTVELAQVTTTPMLVIPLTLSGLYFPLSDLPHPLEQLSRLLPLTPVVDLLRLGLSGTTTDGHTVGFASSFATAVPSVLVLFGWIVLGGLATRRWFRWEPRR
ncbi:ABC-2 type transport system permease protein [Kribbella voronezhensis]|uniref:ABC-2 type transport system permease protein n=1 Tax=Kribbella voronezhensis TaxID=2512212 RepID=A0A4R7TEW3_9ACTN|nr:ABC transporter permease [Kribbella voronezhensis]TDU90705.1 ABC-2 type transport system permease protein [Kribbella voronezhensis]